MLEPLGAAKEAEKGKTRTYLPLAQAEGSVFVPAIVETYGGVGPAFRLLLKHASRFTTCMSRLQFLTAAKKAIHDPLIANNSKILFEELKLAREQPPNWQSVQKHNSSAINKNAKRPLNYRNSERSRAVSLPDRVPSKSSSPFCEQPPRCFAFPVFCQRRRRAPFPCQSNRSCSRDQSSC